MPPWPLLSRLTTMLVVLVPLGTTVAACGLSSAASGAAAGDVDGSSAGAVPGNTAGGDGVGDDAAGSSMASQVTDGGAETTTTSFEDASRLGPAPVPLGSAGTFAILAKSAVTNVPTSKITGDVGLSPAAASGITGFTMTKVGTKWTAPEVVGGIFAADNDAPTPANMTLAVDAMETAYTDAAGRVTPAFVELGAGEIGGLTLTPGLYKWTSAVTMTTDVSLSGGANDVWIFQIAGDLTVADLKRMILIGKLRPKNVFWQVAGAVTLGVSSHVEGIVLSKTAITVGTGASIAGRLLAQTAVTMGGTTVTSPAP
jgi:hypothetical protein